MVHKCINCGWSGRWEELIHETMCPRCKSYTVPCVERIDPELAGLDNACGFVAAASPPGGSSRT